MKLYKNLHTAYKNCTKIPCGAAELFVRSSKKKIDNIILN